MPTLRQAIDAMCGQCRAGDIFIIANCDRDTCPLHPVRPNQVLAGRLPLQYSEEQLRQETLDAINFSGLREWEKLHVSRGDSSIAQPRTRTGDSIDSAGDGAIAQGGADGGGGGI